MDEVDDTEMSPDEFYAALEQGAPVTLVKSRDAYEAAIKDDPAPFDSQSIDSVTVENGPRERTGPVVTVVPWGDLDGMATEKFVSVMLLREYPDGARRRPTQGDGGIDVIVPVSDNPRSWDVYQIKSFAGSLNSGQRAKIRESAHRLLATVATSGLNVRAWHLVLPIDPSAKDQAWIDSLFDGSGILAYWKGLSYLEGLVAKYRDVFDFYVRDGQERLHVLVESALNLAGMQIGAGATGLDEQSLFKSMSTTLDRLSMDDPHYSYALSVSYDHDEILKAPDSVAMSHVVGRPDGPAMRVDVFPKYQLALEDRPITATVRFNVPEDEELVAAAIERFNIYGDDLTVPAEFASASFSDPVSGETTMANAQVKLISRDDRPEVRVRYIVAEDDGTRAASTFFDVQARKSGPSGKGHLFTLRSESGIIDIEQWARTEDGEVYNGTFSFSVNWKLRIAARIANDIRFVNAIRPGRKLVLAHEFTGPYTVIARFDEIEKPPAPDWLLQYVEALAELQEYADVPLLTFRGDEEAPERIVDYVVSIASLLHGNTLLQRSPMMGLVVAGLEPQEVARHINEHASMSLVTPLNVPIANGHVSIPGVLFESSNVSAEVDEADGVERVVISSAQAKEDAEVLVRVRLLTSEELETLRK